MKKLVVAAALLSASSFSLAGSMSSGVSKALTPWPHDAFYTELNAGTNLYYVAIGSFSTKTENAGVTGWGWSGAAGYNFGGYTAVEVGLMQNYDKFEVEDDDDNGDSSDSYVSGHTNIPYLAARFTVPMGRAAFISKVGLMHVSVSATGQVTENGKTTTKSAESPSIAIPFVGLGFGYSITPHIQFIAQYQGAVYAIVGAGLFSAGLDYSF